MRSFKEFDNTSNTTEENKMSETAEELTKKLTDAWNGKNTNLILLEILKEAEQNKKQGKLTNEDLDNFFNEFSPLLDDKQKKQLIHIIDKLKKL